MSKPRLESIQVVRYGSSFDLGAFKNDANMPMQPVKPIYPKRECKRRPGPAECMQCINQLRPKQEFFGVEIWVRSYIWADDSPYATDAQKDMYSLHTYKVPQSVSL